MSLPYLKVSFISLCMLYSFKESFIVQSMYEVDDDAHGGFFQVWEIFSGVVPDI